MLKHCELVLSLFVSILALSLGLPAAAGEVKLVSDTIDMVCRVEVASDPDAPSGSVETYTDVAKGWSITKSGKLCYRRASTPDNCESGMTQWNTQWKCAENAAPGVVEMSLK